MSYIYIYDISNLRVKEIGLEGVDWIDQVQDRIKSHAVVNAVMNLWVPKKCGGSS
jgi:hypothetical protein